MTFILTFKQICTPWIRIRLRIRIAKIMGHNCTHVGKIAEMLNHVAGRGGEVNYASSSAESSKLQEAYRQLEVSLPPPCFFLPRGQKHVKEARFSWILQYSIYFVDTASTSNPWMVTHAGANLGLSYFSIFIC